MSKQQEKEEHSVELSTPELQEKYLAAKAASESLLKKLDLISMDIKRIEGFLQKSGFGSFGKNYENESAYDIYLYFDGLRMRLGKSVLMETKVIERLTAHPFLADFLESIAKAHT